MPIRPGELTVAEHAEFILQRDSVEALCPDPHINDLELAIAGLPDAYQNLTTLLTDTVTEADVIVNATDDEVTVELTRWALTGAGNVTYVSRHASVTGAHAEFDMVRAGKKTKDIARVAATTGKLVVGLAKWGLAEVSKSTIFEAVRKAVDYGGAVDPMLHDIVVLEAEEPDKYQTGLYSIRHLGEHAENSKDFPEGLIAPHIVTSIGLSYSYTQPPLSTIDMTSYANAANRMYPFVPPLSEAERERIREILIHKRLQQLHAFTGVLSLATHELRMGAQLRPESPKAV